MPSSKDGRKGTAKLRRRKNIRATNKKSPARKSWSAPARYRNIAARPLQIADLRPSSMMVKFEGKKRYIVQPASTTTNGKSVLYVPANYMGNGTQISGTWTADAAGDLIDSNSYTFYFGLYKYYKVVSAYVEVVVRPSGEETETTHQVQNYAFVARHPDVSGYSLATTLPELENNRGVVSGVWMCTNTNTVMRPTTVGLGYNPKYEHGLDDVRDYSALRNVTTYNTAGGENTFFNVILCGMLDSQFYAHPDAIVELKVIYNVLLTEPDVGNIPLADL